jgi:3-methyladenine DNA glycosylase AlkD
MISLTNALEQLNSKTDYKKATKMKNSIKINYTYLGISTPEMNKLYKEWRNLIDGDARTVLASELWNSNIYEGRIIAAKLLTQARIANDGAVWNEIIRWIPTLDHHIIADHVSAAGSRRIKAFPERFNQISNWVKDENIWMRQSVLTFTMPWAKLNNPKKYELEQRDQILAWAGKLSIDQEWLIQKALANWLSSLSKHDTPSVLSFLEEHGAKMKPFAINQACKFL